MALSPGTRLGAYEIVTLIGSGGMGEVYRAKDTRLARDVAIKVLPSEVATDPDRLARFEREAQVLASLNHPNIAQIYGVDDSGSVPALVMELVDGPTLADRIAKGPIPLDEALPIAKQIAEALEAAHEQGIIHRDLKPANIKVRPDGTVKVLDFGLAKPFRDSAAPGIQESPTIAVPHTRAGVVVGTAAYMSPEQARGQHLDKRADVWAFGCVFYEMLSGRRLFEGDSQADTIAAILDREPNWRGLPTRAPEAIRRVLERCIQKDRARRARDLGDVALELDHAIARYRSRAHTMRRTVTAGIGLVAIAAMATAIVVRRGRHASPINLDPTVQLTDVTENALSPAISHDGRMLAFVRSGGTFGGSSRVGGEIYVKLLAGGEAVQLTHDGLNKDHPVFTLDDSRIVYTTEMPGMRWDSWQVPVVGGSPRPFLPNASGLEWMDGERIIYSAITSGIHMAIATSTESRTEYREIYSPKPQNGMAHRTAVSPDRQSLLIVEMNSPTWLPCRLVPADGSSDGVPVSPPAAPCVSAAWSPDGAWMFFTSNAGDGFHVWRRRFPAGPLEQITFGPTEQEGTTITGDGQYLITSMGLSRTSIWMHDLAGERSLTSEGNAIQPTFVPSRNRVLYVMRATSDRTYASGELWGIDIATGERERVLPGLTIANYSVSPDGTKLVFTTPSGTGNAGGIWVAELDRRTPPRRVTRAGERRAFFAGRDEVVYMSEGEDHRLYRIALDGSAVRMVASDPISDLMTVSPDGRWVSVMRPSGGPGGGTKLELVSLRGEPAIPFCNEACDIGPRSLLSGLPVAWDLEGTSMYVNLGLFGARPGRTAVMPYRANAPAKSLWPRGLRFPNDIEATPGTKIIDRATMFPGSGTSTYLFSKLSSQSNLYRLRLPN